jgi:hypothetical protein
VYVCIIQKGDLRTLYHIWSENLKGINQLDKPKCRSENNTKTDLENLGANVRTGSKVTQDRFQSRDFLITELNFLSSETKSRNFSH